MCMRIYWFWSYNLTSKTNFIEGGKRLKYVYHCMYICILKRERGEEREGVIWFYSSRMRKKNIMERG